MRALARFQSIDNESHTYDMFVDLTIYDVAGSLRDLGRYGSDELSQ